MTPVDFVEALRKVLVETLVPELRDLRREMDERFAQMNERFAALQKQMEERFAALQKQMEERFARVDERFARVDERFARMDERFAALQKQMEERFARVDERFVEIRGDIKLILGRLDYSERIVRLEAQIQEIRERLPAA